ncbi:DUF1934 domain-containing protein [uncultured Selenomonas sp.]|uniref:DUF1934 domain-containing protein n=1 Tax=uncultured Selenomonas sp. TaxID=159275 RepID=UPI0028D22322|nr:DUF1934 domain-containing protein [uncultured Selenomonas sp.]
MKGAEQVQVSLLGRQVDAAGEESRIALSVMGRRFLRGESRYVSYDDTELIEGETIPTVLRIGAAGVMLQRRGVVRHTQHFVPGEERPSSYRTPYGTLTLTTVTRRLRARMLPDGAEEAYIFYTLYVDGVRQSDNTLEIRIEPSRTGDQGGYQTAD